MISLLACLVLPTFLACPPLPMQASWRSCGSRSSNCLPARQQRRQRRQKRRQQLIRAARLRRLGPGLLRPFDFSNLRRST